MNKSSKLMLLVPLLLVFSACQRHWGEYINAPVMDYQSLEQAPVSLEVDQIKVKLSGDIWMDYLPKIGPGPFKNLHVSWKLFPEDSANAELPPVTARMLWVVCDTNVYVTPINTVEGQVALEGFCACNKASFIVIQLVFQGRSYLIRSPRLTVECAA